MSDALRADAQEPIFSVGPATTSAKGFALASLIVGIVALPALFFGWYGIVLGVIAIALGIVALIKGQSRALSAWGITCGAIGLLGGITMLMLFQMFISLLTVMD